MEFKVENLAPQDVNTQLLVAGLFEGEKPSEGGLGRLDIALGGRIELAATRDDFNGKSGEKLLLYGLHTTELRRVLIIGLGNRDKITAEKIRRAYGKAGKFARGENISEAVLMPPLKGFQPEDESWVTSAAAEGFALATYRFNQYRSRELEKNKNLEKLTVIPGEPEGLQGVEEGTRKAEITVHGNFFARDLANTPAMDIYPESLAAKAKELEGGNVKVELISVDQIKELGMGAFMGVAQGSQRPPVLIHLTYDPGIKNAKTFAFVGKGITFDAGGLDLKPAAGMRDMKLDMCGAAAVMGLFQAINKWKPACKVEGYIAAAENMPGGNAYKPGDVLKCYNGLTVEIDNTDAEGRLTLADALAYAVDTVKPDVVVDIATLTGACWIALGTHATGMMGTSPELKEILEEAGEFTGERVWELPLWDEYGEQISSEIADVKNTGGRPGGAITAGMFLKEFVGDTPWIHLDIAGSSSEVPYSYIPHKELATGVGVRLILEVLNKWA